MEIIGQTIAAAKKSINNGDCISDKEIGYDGRRFCCG